MSKPFRIMGRYRGKVEEIDRCDTQQEAIYLRGEYLLAFGRGWQIWINFSKGEEKS